MKRLIIGAMTAVVVSITFGSCKSEYINYNGPEYVMFSDTLSICPVTDNNKEFPIYIASLNSSDYDRTYSVEVVPQKSSAVYEQDFTLDKTSVTIKAGQNTAVINVKPVYDNIKNDESLEFQLRLRSLLDDEFSVEGCTTRVELRKICPFDINDFTGYCIVASTYLQYTQPSNYRTFKCEIVEGEENTILMTGLFYKGYDVKVKFDASDPLIPTMKIIDSQVIGDTRDVFSWIYGDCRIWAMEAPGYTSTFSPGKKEAIQYMLAYIEEVGTINIYGNVYKWIEDYEAE